VDPDNPTLAGRPAIVTGAGRGIGRAVAAALARAGAPVLCADIDADGAAATADGIARSGGVARLCRCDVSREADAAAAVEAALEAFGGVRILVCAAAAHDRAGTVVDIDESEWTRVFAVNVAGTYLMCRAALPEMIAAGGGSIILVASQLGRVAAPERAVYCATKGAVIQLAKAMAVDHAAQNVRVNALSPGAVATERLEQRYGDLKAARRSLGPKHLLGRLGEPDEIAAAAVFLASDAASFITGSDFLVDGGYSAV